MNVRDIVMGMLEAFGWFVGPAVIVLRKVEDIDGKPKLQMLVLIRTTPDNWYDFVSFGKKLYEIPSVNMRKFEDLLAAAHRAVAEESTNRPHEDIIFENWINPKVRYYETDEGSRYVSFETTVTVALDAPQPWMAFSVQARAASAGEYKLVPTQPIGKKSKEVQRAFWLDLTEAAKLMWSPKLWYGPAYGVVFNFLEYHWKAVHQKFGITPPPRPKLPELTDHQ